MRHAAQKSTGLLSATLLVLLAVGCGVKKIGGRVVDEKCDRDVLEVWNGKSCATKTEEEVAATVTGAGGTSNAVCTEGVNNTLCQRPLAEDSYWASEEHSYKAPTGDDVTYKGYYKFNYAAQTWEHYLFQSIPFLDQAIYERRAGTLEIHTGFADDYVVMTLAESSCEGQQSLFEIFDTPQRDIYVGRLDSAVALAMSAEITSAAGIKVEEYLEHIFASMYTYLYDLVFGPFTPEFWQSVVTGSYYYTADTRTDFEAAAAGGKLTCFSSVGYAELEDEMDIPPAVKAALDASRP